MGARSCSLVCYYCSSAKGLVDLWGITSCGECLRSFEREHFELVNEYWNQ